MTETNFNKVNQINLSEIFAIIWSHKLLIVISVLFAFSYGSFKISGMERIYTAKAIFKLEALSSNSSIPMNDEVGAIAALAGISGLSTDSTDILLERMSNKEFILLVSKNFLWKMINFNTYTLPSDNPWWRLRIKSFLGMNENEGNHSFVTAEIVRNYSAYVNAEKTEAGAIEISFSHKDAQKASQYANSIMDIVKNLIKTEKEDVSDERLTYLTETG